MKKKMFMIAAGSLLIWGIGSFACSLAGQEKAVFSSMITSAGGETIHATISGKDVTEEYQKRERKTKESVAEFLNRDLSKIQFHDYCMLEMDGMTVEATVEGVEYTFTFNIEGELLCISRSDGKQLKRRS